MLKSIKSVILLVYNVLHNPFRFQLHGEEHVKNYTVPWL